MLTLTTIAYARRHNADGTTDSICRHCFITVVTAWREADLNRAELDHACDPNLLEYWNEMRERGESNRSSAPAAKNSPLEITGELRRNAMRRAKSANRPDAR